MYKAKQINASYCHLEKNYDDLNLNSPRIKAKT